MISEVTPEWIGLVAQTIPQFLFAVVLFYLCQSNSDKQRTAYQEQLDKLYSMLETMLHSVSRSLDLMEEKSKHN